MKLTKKNRALVLSAARTAMSVLPYFEKAYPKDKRPRRAIAEARKWARGNTPMKMKVIRKASLDAHAAARKALKAKKLSACFAARSAGQAAATVHVATHAKGAKWYADKARKAANGN